MQKVATWEDPQKLSLYHHQFGVFDYEQGLFLLQVGNDVLSALYPCTSLDDGQEIVFKEDSPHVPV